MASEKMTLGGLGEIMHTLAQMTQEGFFNENERMDNMEEKLEKKIDSLEIKVDSLEMEIIAIRKNLQNIIYRHEYEALKDRIEILEKRFLGR
ncbi:MAG: hypothetical protein FJY91_01415 [Candidatus Harrisonbacteria bacterium]|nr:hypothetical protein [Candidatus Harrisonbacteria bacterium]